MKYYESAQWDPFVTLVWSDRTMTMRPFIHQSLAWTAFFAVTSVLMFGIALVSGRLDLRFQSMSGATQGLLFIIVVSSASGIAIAGIIRFFDWAGWVRDPQQKSVRNPIVRAAIAPVLMFIALLFLLWVLPPSWR